jgi:hypothetical protein
MVRRVPVMVVFHEDATQASGDIATVVQLALLCDASNLRHAAPAQRHHHRRHHAAEPDQPGHPHRDQIRLGIRTRIQVKHDRNIRESDVVLAVDVGNRPGKRIPDQNSGLGGHPKRRGCLPMIPPPSLRSGPQRYRILFSAARGLAAYMRNAESGFALVRNYLWDNGERTAAVMGVGAEGYSHFLDAQGDAPAYEQHVRDATAVFDELYQGYAKLGRMEIFDKTPNAWRNGHAVLSQAASARNARSQQKIVTLTPLASSAGNDGRIVNRVGVAFEQLEGRKNEQRPGIRKSIAEAHALEPLET